MQARVPGDRCFRIATFGCKVNQYDSQLLREELIGQGWHEARPDETPDAVIVNTCTVTHTADAKARRLIRRTARRHPGARIVVTGCAVNRDPAALARLPNVWAVLDNGAKPDIAAVLDGADGGARLSGHANTFRPGSCIRGFAGHTRAFVKVQDGCDAHCAYCIVPSVRGPDRSRPQDEILREVARLSERFKEIVLTGIHVGRYRDLGDGTDLAGLARRVLETTSVRRLRLSSIEAGEITPALLDLAESSPRFCPHFHVPLQSGSDRVLGRMGRPYTAAEFLAVADRVRHRLVRPAFGTDVIVGFPGETDADFEETLAVCRSAGFARTHVFPYSDRPGTAAADLRQKCPAAVVTDRKHALGGLADDLALRYKRSFVGETVEVLVETSRDRAGRLRGYTDRYLRVVFDGPDELRRRLVPVRVSGAEADTLRGRPEKA
jgi:threonylcarbamoyladenosine tRNA methylthiotransferase MtaB